MIARGDALFNTRRQDLIGMILHISRALEFSQWVGYRFEDVKLFATVERPDLLR